MSERALWRCTSCRTLCLNEGYDFPCPVCGGAQGQVETVTAAEYCAVAGHRFDDTARYQQSIRCLNECGLAAPAHRACAIAGHVRGAETIVAAEMLLDGGEPVEWVARHFCRRCHQMLDQRHMRPALVATAVPAQADPMGLIAWFIMILGGFWMVGRLL